MKHVVMIDNFDSFTFNLVDYFKQGGVRITVQRNTAAVSTIKQLKPNMIVYSPGPGNPKQAGNLLKYIEFFSQQLVVPQFGVCLGLQAMIEAFGGSLRVLPHPIHGKASYIHHQGEGIFQSLPNPLLAGRYHSLAAEHVPADFDVTATTQDDRNGEVVMAIQHRHLPLVGVQFHPESVLTMHHQAGLHLIRNVIAQ
ncbi:MAG: aminodeoxychorismate/anthranilate synthase component II [Candidatus Kerfeldbacteria bacterium]|nr:aminodeoxychorismate/anthranilate synthase component II [Candidatus Kerfeldbacteria bacterium]